MLQHTILSCIFPCVQERRSKLHSRRWISLDFSLIFLVSEEKKNQISALQSRSVVFMLAVLSPSLFCLPYTFQCLQFPPPHPHPPFCQLLMKYHLQHFHLDSPSGVNLFRQQNAADKNNKTPKKKQTLINSNMKFNSAAVMSQYRAARTHHAELHRPDGAREQEAVSNWNGVKWILGWNCDRHKVVFNLESIHTEQTSELHVNNRDVNKELQRNM